MLLDLIQASFNVYLYPCPQNYIKFAKETVSLLQDTAFQKAVQAVGDSHIMAARDIANNMALERDMAGAIQRILANFEAAYQLYKVVYDKKTFSQSIFIPSAVSDLAKIFNGSDKLADELGKICVAIASYHHAQGDDTQLVKEWAIKRIQSNHLEPAAYIKEEELVILVGEQDAKKYFLDYWARYKKSLEEERLNSMGEGNMPSGQYYGD